MSVNLLSFYLSPLLYLEFIQLLIPFFIVTLRFLPFVSPYNFFNFLFISYFCSPTLPFLDFFIFPFISLSFFLSFSLSFIFHTYVKMQQWEPVQASNLVRIIWLENIFWLENIIWLEDIFWLKNIIWLEDIFWLENIIWKISKFISELRCWIGSNQACWFF